MPQTSPRLPCTSPTALTVLDLLDLQLLKVAGDEGCKHAAGVAHLVGRQLEVAAGGRDRGRKDRTEVRGRQQEMGATGGLGGFGRPLPPATITQRQLASQPLGNKAPPPTPLHTHLKMGSWSMLPGLRRS